MRAKKFSNLMITLAVILFASCNKDNEVIIDDDSLIFSYHRYSGWVGWDDLKKTFNLSAFTKIHNESCNSGYDIPANRFSVSVNGEVYSFLQWRM